MRIVPVLLVCASLSAVAAAASEKGQSRRVGPWNVASFSDKGRFQHCIMARAETRTGPGFGLVRGRAYFGLALFSTKWKLAPGTSYPVSLVAGAATAELQATVESATAVMINLTGQDAFVAALPRAAALEVRTPATTLRLPLDQSGAAMAKLDDCFAAEAQVASSNPFAGGGQPASPAQPANPFAAPAAPKPPAPAKAAEEAKEKPDASATAAAAPAPSAKAADEAYARLRADCEQDEDPDRQVAGCTAVIESGREPVAVQGIAASNRGFGHYKKGDLPRALASYTEAIRLYPDYANAHWGRADIHSEMQSWDAAILDYSAALKLDPKDDYSLQNRARAHIRKAAYDAAIADLTEALRLKPENAGALADRAAAEQRRGELDRALADFDAALKIAPTLATALAGREEVQAALAAAAPGTTAEERRGVAAIALVEVAPRACGYSAVFSTLGEIAGWSGLSAEKLDADPIAALKRRQVERARAELAADKAAFCERVLAEYGPEGTKLKALVTE